MSKKEIKILDDRIDYTQQVILVIAFLGAFFIAMLLINAMQEEPFHTDTEWQCTQWEETDELVNCVEKTMSISFYPENGENADEECKKKYGSNANYNGGFFSDSCYGRPCLTPAYAGCEINNNRKEIKCEHKKVCTQETLVREVGKE